MDQKRFVTGRQWCVPQAKGIVLEIGFGAGANLPHYTRDVSKLFAFEPSKELFNTAIDSIQTTFKLSQIVTRAENIPLAKNSIDSIICTWTLCSVENITEVVQELYRVLKPNGKVIFIEHGKSKHPALQIFQNLFNNLWRNVQAGVT